MFSETKLDLRKMVFSFLAIVSILLFSNDFSYAAGRQQMHGHMPPLANATFIGNVPDTTSLELAIGLPLRNLADLQSLEQELYDPSNPLYKHFITPEQFAARFGPLSSDYQTVIDFVKSKRLKVIRTHSNNVVLTVSGKVSDIQRAFNVHIRRYQKSDGTLFFSPDNEPSLDLEVPIASISGLENYWKPRSFMKIGRNSNGNTRIGKARNGKVSKVTGIPAPFYGTGPTVNNTPTYAGDDFINAYAPGTSYDGTGQSVGLLEFDGFDSSDITTYESNALSGRGSFPTVTTVLTDSISGSAGLANGEVCLDIEVAMSMASKLDQIVVYEGNLGNDILSEMVAPSSGPFCNQLSSSWGNFTPDTDATMSALLTEMSLQGQSFFQASGDSGAYLYDYLGSTYAYDPGDIRDENYVTVVGGTELYTNNPTPGSTPYYQTESAWDYQYSQGSGGGGFCNGNSAYPQPPAPTPTIAFSSVPIPTYQAAIATQIATAVGNTSYRNLPDVSAAADNIYVVAHSWLNVGTGTPTPGPQATMVVGGTSAAAPLWAAYISLANQQGSSSGLKMGFANPSFYKIAQSPTPYASDFHDINDGSVNQSEYSIYGFQAISGYDLATGLGSPNGGLLNEEPQISSPFCYSTQWGTSGSSNGQFGFHGVRYAVPFGNYVYVSDTNNNRIQKFDTSGSFIWALPASGTSSGSGNGQFNSPKQIAVDSVGNVYVADQGNNRVQVLDPSGQTLMNFGSSGSGDGQFTGPTAIGVDTNGYIYVSDFGNYRIEKFNPQGAYLAKWGSSGSGTGTSGNFNSVYSLAIDQNNYIYTIDAGNYKVQKFSCVGTTPTAVINWGSNGTGNGQFSYPLGIAVGPCGDIYVADQNQNSIQMFSNTGTYIQKYASSGSGNGQFTNPWGLGFDGSNNLYVADMIDNRIEKFTSCGISCSPTPTPTPLYCYSAQWGTSGSGNGQFSHPRQMACAGTTIYVSDTNNNRIQYFTTGGTYLGQWGSSGSGNGQFNLPMQVAVAGSTIYVADASNNRVQAFDLTGTFLFTFGSSGSGNGQFNAPEGVGIDGSDNVFVFDLGNSRIEKFTATGTYVSTYGSNGSGNGQFNGVYSIAVTGLGSNPNPATIYVADSANHRVQEITCNGSSTWSFVNAWGTTGSGFSQMGAPYGIALDSCGNIYTADQGGNNNRIQIYTSGGTYEGQYNSVGTGSLNGQFNTLWGLAFDSSNDMFVADMLNNRIQKFADCGLPASCSTPIPTPWPSSRKPLSGSALDEGEREGSPTPTFTITSTPSVTATPTGVPDMVMAEPNISRGGGLVKFLVNLRQPGIIQLSLFSLTGEQVRQFTVNGSTGGNTINWDLQNEASSSVASGLYIYVARFDDGSEAITHTGKVAVFR